MPGKEKLPPELIAFEAKLASLQPDLVSLDMGRLMFLAGQESAMNRPRPWNKFAWPTAFTAMTAAAAMLLVMLVSRPQPEIVERIVRVEVPVQVEDPTQATPTETREPATETDVSTMAEDEQPMKYSPNRGPVRGLLASLFFNRTSAIDKIPSDPRRLSYQELLNQLSDKGTDDRPTQTFVRPRRANKEPMTRETLLESLLHENT